MNKRTIITAAAALFLSIAALNPAAAEKKQNVLDVKESITDSDIIFPESFETDTQKMLEGWYMKNYTATDRRYETQEDVATDDATFRSRLAALPAVIELPYNQIVRSYIERYTSRGRAQVAAMLGLGNYYMPIFEQALEENGLPLELKYLPIIESALDPNAVSRHGATGLWQFMLATAKGLGLEVSSLVDERRDPYLSSQVAARFLKDLYATYGDWSLAIAAYNCGPGTVNKAIRRAGGDPAQHDFWSIYYYLPSETRGYVPMFIAANYVMNYYPKHNISPVIPTKPLITDTVQVAERVHFNQISKVLDIPVDELRVLNPQFRADIIPGTADHPYTLILPSQQIHAYIMSEQDILAYESEKYSRRTTAEPGAQPSDAAAAEAEAADIAEAENTFEEMANAPTAKTVSQGPTKTLTHKVAPGESLAVIAERYSVTPEDIKSWNNLRRNAVRTGQILRITAPAQTADAAPRQSESWQNSNAAAATAQPAKSTKKTTTANAAASSKKKQQAAKPKTHTLRSGDNLTTVAKKYGVTVAELKKANGLTSDNLRAGETLTIPVKGSTVKSSKSSKKKSPAKKSTSKKKSKKRR